MGLVFKPSINNLVQNHQLLDCLSDGRKTRDTGLMLNCFIHKNTNMGQRYNQCIAPLFIEARSQLMILSLFASISSCGKKLFYELTNRGLRPILLALVVVGMSSDDIFLSKA
jgi:hypothetical protein